MVLEDVARGAEPLVEGGTPLDSDRLRNRDLNVVDVLTRPERLEDPVREPEREHVLDRLLAEVVVDAEDLVLAEVASSSWFSRRAEARSVPNGFSTITRPQPELERRSPISRASVAIAFGGTAR